MIAKTFVLGEGRREERKGVIRVRSENEEGSVSRNFHIFSYTVKTSHIYNCLVYSPLQ